MPIVKKSLVCNGVVVNSIAIDTDHNTYVPDPGCTLEDPAEYPYIPEEWPVEAPAPDETA